MFVPCFAEMSTNIVSPPYSSATRLYSVSCWRILAGLAPSLSILLTATTIGTSRRLGVVDRLHRLRHHAVVGRDHDHRDVRGLRAAGTHGGERLVTRGVDEGDRPLVALQLGDHLVGADVLGDAAGLALADVGVADRVQQARLAVVDVTHDRDDRRPEHEVVLVARVLAVGDGEAVEQLAVLLLRADDLDVVVHLAAEQLEDLVGDRLGGGDHLTEVEQHLHQRGRVGADLVGEVGQRRTAGELDVSPRPFGRRTPPTEGACIESNSWRFCRFDLRPLRAGPPGRPNAPAAPPRPRPPPPPPGRPPPPPPPAETAAGRGTAATGTAATGTETATAAAATGTEPPPPTAGTTAGTAGTTAGTAATDRPPGPPGRPPPPGRVGHHAGVRARGHVARRRPRAAATGLTGPRGRPGADHRDAGRRPGPRVPATLRGAPPCRRGRAGPRRGRARRGAGTDAEGVVADPRRARAGLGGLRARRDGGRAGHRRRRWAAPALPGRSAARTGGTVRTGAAQPAAGARAGRDAARPALAPPERGAVARAAGAGCAGPRAPRAGGGRAPPARSGAAAAAVRRGGGCRGGTLRARTGPGRTSGAGPAGRPVAVARGGAGTARRGGGAPGRGADRRTGRARGRRPGADGRRDGDGSRRRSRHRPWTRAAGARRGPRPWRRGTSRTHRGPAAC